MLLEKNSHTSLMPKFGMCVTNATSRYNYLAYFGKNICQKNISKTQGKQKRLKKEKEYQVLQNVKEKFIHMYIDYAHKGST